MEIKVHGVFNSFGDMGKALGFKQPKAKKEKPRKCNVCGGQMNKVADNVWACPFHKLMDEKLVTADGTETDVQVFDRCGNFVIEGG